MDEATPSLTSAPAQLELPWSIPTTPLAEITDGDHWARPTPTIFSRGPNPEPSQATDTQATDTIALGQFNPAAEPSGETTSETPISSSNNRPSRVTQLEQALDQCQVYIEELKQQLVEQQFLEDILARTEETAQIQQQAILSLKQQLAQHQTTQAQFQELQASHEKLNQHLQQLHQAYQAQNLALAETQTQLQQRQEELQHLQTQLRPNQDQIKLLQYRITQLEAQVQERQQSISEFEARLHRSAQVVTAQQDIISALQQAQGSDSNKNQVIQRLSQNLLAAQNKIQGLEAEYATQRLQQAKLQHHAQEVEEHAIQQQVRINKLEQQVAEMQEQILHQAQQAREQETAIQHWKDRHYHADKTVLQLKAVLNNILNERHFLELMNLDADSLSGTWGPGNELLEEMAQVMGLLGEREKETEAGVGASAYLLAPDHGNRGEEPWDLSSYGIRTRSH